MCCISDVKIANADIYLRTDKNAKEFTLHSFAFQIMYTLCSCSKAYCGGYKLSLSVTMGNNVLCTARRLYQVGFTMDTEWRGSNAVHLNSLLSQYS